jgi:hypothetical protein
MLPLYEAPDGYWLSFYNLAVANPTTQFTVIVSVDNGPFIVKSALFVNGLTKITSAPNVRAIGYIDTV